jgi:hypothetical protein
MTGIGSRTNKQRKKNMCGKANLPERKDNKSAHGTYSAKEVPLLGTQNKEQKRTLT